uniref:Uncharacterized protein n=1 Tax=Rhizophora mucronata TaxID=61149 RepID=A0A2P2PZJ5_RHIMU
MVSRRTFTQVDRNRGLALTRKTSQKKTRTSTRS